MAYCMRDVCEVRWTFSRRWVGDLGLGDLSHDIPLDGGDNEGWRDDGFLSGW